MKRTLLFCVLIVFFTISFISLVGCNNKKEDYKLQEKCGKRGEEFIKNYKERYDLKYGTIQHQSHYNKKLNKCFVRTYYYERHRYIYDLWDVNENVSYGQCSGVSLDDILCINKREKTWDMKKTEWDKLVEPLMTE